MNRDAPKKLALMRLEDARVLLDNGNYEGTYYLYCLRWWKILEESGR